MAAPKRTKTEREEVLAIVAKLDRRGYSQTEIARELGVSQVQVCYDLKKVRKRYQEVMIHERKELVQEKLAQYQELRREAWEAWEKSKLASRRVVKEQELWDSDDPNITEDDSKGKPKAPQRRRKKQITTQDQCGDTQYLIVIAKCLQAERDLLGLDPVKQLEVQSTNVNWDVLFARTSTPSSIERELRDIESKVALLEAKPDVVELGNGAEYTQDNGNGTPTQSTFLPETHNGNGYHATPEEPYEEDLPEDSDSDSDNN